MAQPIIIRFVKEVRRRDTNLTQPGNQATGTVTVQGNVTILLAEGIIDRFNIPAPGAGVNIATRRRRRTYTYTRFAGLAAGVVVTVPEYEYTPASKTVKGMSARVATGYARGAGQRTVGIPFPGWFTIGMVNQAIGSMLRANQPTVWKLAKSGKTYPFVANTDTAVPTGATNGAWIVTTNEANINAGEGVISDESIIKAASGRRWGRVTP